MFTCHKYINTAFNICSSSTFLILQILFFCSLSDLVASLSQQPEYFHCLFLLGLDHGCQVQQELPFLNFLTVLEVFYRTTAPLYQVCHKQILLLQYRTAIFKIVPKLWFACTYVIFVSFDHMRVYFVHTRRYICFFITLCVYIVIVRNRYENSLVKFDKYTLNA